MEAQLRLPTTAPPFPTLLPTPSEYQLHGLRALTHLQLEALNPGETTCNICTGIYGDTNDAAILLHQPTASLTGGTLRGHVACGRCLEEWFVERNTCPDCREVLFQAEVVDEEDIDGVVYEASALPILPVGDDDDQPGFGDEYDAEEGYGSWTDVEMGHENIATAASLWLSGALTATGVFQSPEPMADLDLGDADERYESDSDVPSSPFDCDAHDNDVHSSPLIPDHTSPDQSGEGSAAANTDDDDKDYEPPIHASTSAAPQNDASDPRPESRWSGYLAVQ